jgi:hypothetical protein
VAAVDGKAEPSVGLLNIGEEAIKGSDIIKRAGELLRAAGEADLISFQGNVEGNDIFKGKVDVVVCDGFVGNVLLKTSEGLASMLSDFIRQEFTRNPLTKLAALVAMPVLKHFKRRVDPRRYNGAALLGCVGLVFKSHGSADAYAFENALMRAYDAARNRLLDRVTARSAPRSWLPSGMATLVAPPQNKRHEPKAHGQPFRTALRAHHRHRQLPAAAAPVQRRHGRACWRGAGWRPAMPGSLSAPASAHATSPKTASTAATWPCTRHAPRCRPPGARPMTWT